MKAVSTVVASLNRHRDWIAKQQGTEPAETRADRAEDIVVGCLDLIDTSPLLDLEAWLNRRDRRRLLEACRMKYVRKDGIKAITQLIDLTISELLACRPFRPRVAIGVLPVRTREMPPEHILAMHEARRSAAKQRRETIESHPNLANQPAA